LYRFHDAEWRERGKGNVRILKHKTSGLQRLIMRESGTGYVRANHVIDPREALTAPEGDATGARFRFDAMDFADNQAMTAQLFLIRFKDAAGASEFKTHHDAARLGNAPLVASGSDEDASASASSAAAAGAEDAGEPDESGPVPETGDLMTAWGVDAEDATRIDALSAAFAAKYGSPPDFFAHAPGRVNIIGEHIDYHHFSVMPFALRQDIVFAVGSAPAATGEVELNNMDARFGACSVSADPTAAVDTSDGIQWQHYFQAGYKAAFASMPAGTEPKPMRVLVDGRVPPGGGVSSSSAMSVGSCLATLKHHSHAVTRAALASAAQKAEAEAVGTMSGGMDQAISCMGEAGKAMQVDFAPLKATPVSLPASAAFIVANTLLESTKAVNPEERYNMRVTEGLLAIKLVAKAAGIEAWRDVHYMRELIAPLGVSNPGDLTAPIEANLKEGAYSQTELEEAFGEPIADVMATCDRKERVAAVLASNDVGAAVYDLRKRARHVATEAQRVLDFGDACAGDHTADTAASLGALMDASHASCRDDYECSCEELDRLCEVAKKAGALGARLTGAGWGGCMVALVEAGTEEAVIAAMDTEYYASQPDERRIAARFASKPAAGAAVYVPAAEEF
jgi:N-acetylgalactosamine kinase